MDEAALVQYPVSQHSRDVECGEFARLRQVTPRPLRRSTQRQGARRAVSAATAAEARGFAGFCCRDGQEATAAAAVTIHYGRSGCNLNGAPRGASEDLTRCRAERKDVIITIERTDAGSRVLAAG
jgi:hypothetical protein